MNSLILVRGLPGSGKSTFARQCVSQAPDKTAHFEADMYFMEGDKYLFNPSKLAEAHAWCLMKTRNALQEGKTVYVANTFTRYWEMKNYRQLADEFNIPCHVITMNGIFQNIHGVPREVILNMQQRWEH